MWEGHPLALTGWLEADQAEFDPFAPQKGRWGLKGHRLPLLRAARRSGAHRRFCLRGFGTAGFCTPAEPGALERRGGAPWIWELLTLKGAVAARREPGAENGLLPTARRRRLVNNCPLGGF